MARFHINPETGNPGSCSAREGNCPFGSDDEHYTSEVAARQAYEKQMDSESFSTFRDKNSVKSMKAIAQELIDTTLARHEALVARRATAPGTPERKEASQKVAETRAANENAIAKTTALGLTPKSFIYGVDHTGAIFNKAQLHRIRMYPEEDYSRLAGVEVSADSPLPMPGDDWISRREIAWEKGLAKLKAAEFSTPAAKRRAQDTLIRNVIKELPDKQAAGKLSEVAKLNEFTAIRVYQVTPGVAEVAEIRAKAGVSQQNGAVFAERALARASKFIEKVWEV